jgi:hypothetical protein
MLRIPSPATVIAVIAVFVAGAGSAIAADLVTSQDIKNGTIGLKDISKKARKALKGKRGPQGPQGLPGQNGTNGQNGLPGAPGTALAYATVTPGASPTFVEGSVQGFDNVYQGAGNTGIYCLRVPAGIDIADRPRVATVEIGNTPNALGNKTVTARLGAAGGSACPQSSTEELARTVEVRTYRLEIGDDTPTSGEQINNAPSNEVGFTVIVG